MQEYKSKKDLINEINKQANLFIEEFYNVNELNKSDLVDGVDRSPLQMISYQLGWMNLILFWEKEEQEGNTVITPALNYKWNNLGGLYQDFYNQYANYSLQDICTIFIDVKDKIINLIESYSEEELFEKNKRKWASSTPSNWPVWKWIHINTVAPFKNFRTKIRKWKKLKS